MYHYWCLGTFTIKDRWFYCEHVRRRRLLCRRNHLNRLTRCGYVLGLLVGCLRHNRLIANHMHIGRAPLSSDLGKGVIIIVHGSQWDRLRVGQKTSTRTSCSESIWCSVIDKSAFCHLGSSDHLCPNWHCWDCLSLIVYNRRRLLLLLRSW